MTARIYIAGPISGRPVAEYTRDFREAQSPNPNPPERNTP